MTKEQIKREIENLQEAVYEQSQIILKHKQQIPQIELDIILDNLRKLYQAYAVLNKLNNTVSEADSVTEEKPDTSKGAQQEKNQEPFVPNLPKEAYKETPQESLKDIPAETNTEEEKAHQKKAVESTQKDTNKEEKTIETEKKEEKPKVAEEKVEQSEDKDTSPDLFSETVTMSDKFKNDTKSINEKIAQSLVDRTLASKIKKSPIADLKAAIGVNEKFRFIGELFDGNFASYNETIDKLNSFNNIEEAAKYLEILLGKYKWKSDMPAFVMLSELIGRRYMI